MLELEAYMKKYFKNEKEKNPNAIGDHDGTNCWLCEKDLESTRRCSLCEKTGHPHIICGKNRIVKDYCHLTGKFRRLAHNKSN